jgi:hypothetical protein
MRVPNYPLHASTAALTTLQQYVDADVQVISHCSTQPAHSHAVDLKASISSGANVPDHAWKKAQTCPECGAPGGGLTLRPQGTKR